MEVGPPPGPPPAGVAVREVRGGADAAAVAAAMGPERELVALRLARGCRCFAAFQSGRVAAYGWLSSTPEWIGEMSLRIRPGPREAYVWNCVTLPEHRLRGLFRSLLTAVVAAGREERLVRLWIGSLEGTAERAAEQAGFVRALSLSARWWGPVRLVEARPAPGAPPDLAAAALAALSLSGRSLGLARGRRH